MQGGFLRTAQFDSEETSDAAEAPDDHSTLSTSVDMDPRPDLALHPCVK